MTPYESAARIEQIARHLAQVLPPSDRWIAAALLRRVRDPSKTLDTLLGLNGNAGRQGGIGSRMPERDRRLRALASKIAGPTCRKAQLLLERLECGDKRLSAIDRFCKIPRSHRQIVRILK